MPGVVISTATKAGPAGAQSTASGQAFFVGLTERGSTTQPVTLYGMADIARELGPRPTFGNLWDQLKVFFDEGGAKAR